jgi:hypothetical protein
MAFLWMFTLAACWCRQPAPGEDRSRCDPIAVVAGVALVVGVARDCLAATSEEVQNGQVTTEVQWSELQRDPKSVAALADQGDVRVRRRDGVPLLLVREDSAASAADGAVSAARALRNALAHLPGAAAADALVEEFPWVDLLPEADRVRFVADFVRAVGASAELGRWSVLAQVLVEWKSTAAVYADPSLAADLTRPLESDLGPVPARTGS